MFQPSQLILNVVVNFVLVWYDFTYNKCKCHTYIVLYTIEFHESALFFEDWALQLCLPVICTQVKMQLESLRLSQVHERWGRAEPSAETYTYLLPMYVAHVCAQKLLLHFSTHP